MMVPPERRVLGVALAVILLLPAGCDNAKESAEGGISAAHARAIAKEAYIYGFPMAANYQTMYKQAIDTTNHDYQGAVQHTAQLEVSGNARRQVCRDAELGHALLLFMDGPAGAAGGGHSAEDRDQPLLHGADGRSVHVQLRVPGYARFWERGWNIHDHRTGLEWSDASRIEGGYSFGDAVCIHHFSYPAVERG